MRLILFDVTLTEIRADVAPTGPLVGRCILDGDRLTWIGLPKDVKGATPIGTWMRTDRVVDGHAPGPGLVLAVPGDGPPLATNGGKTCALEPVEVLLVPFMTDYHARSAGLIDATLLRGMTVLVIGASSVGAKIAVDSARAGVGRLILMDHDRVEVANLSRTIFNTLDLGERKTDATARHIALANPFTEVVCFPEDVRIMPRELLEQAIAQANLVVGATDSPEAQQLLNAIAYAKTPTIYPGIYPQGSGGEVIATVPGETPCLACILGPILEQRPEHLQGTWDYTLPGQLKAEPALLADIQAVVTRAVTLGLAILLRDDTTSSVRTVFDPARSVLFVGNRQDWIFREPFETHWAHAERDPKCSVCGSEPEGGVS